MPKGEDTVDLIDMLMMQKRADMEARSWTTASRMHRSEPSFGNSGSKLTWDEQAAWVTQQMARHDALDELAKPFARSNNKRLVRYLTDRGLGLGDKIRNELAERALDESYGLATFLYQRYENKEADS